jgi:hypothetical protein
LRDPDDSFVPVLLIVSLVALLAAISPISIVRVRRSRTDAHEHAYLLDGHG